MHGGLSQKKCANRIKRWEPPAKDISGNPARTLDGISIAFDMYLLAGMVLGIMGAFFQMKILVWTALYLSLMCCANYRSEADFRQIASSFMISGMSMLMVYNRDPTPLA